MLRLTALSPRDAAVLRRGHGNHTESRFLTRLDKRSDASRNLATEKTTPVIVLRSRRCRWGIENLGRRLQQGVLFHVRVSL